MQTLNRRHLAGLLMVLAFGSACKAKKADGPTGPGGDPTITLAISPNSATVEQGGSGTATVTLTRAGEYAGAVAIAAEGAPIGVSATVGTPQGSGTSASASVTIQVGAAVPAGTYPIVLRGTGDGVAAATTTFQLTVAEAPNYALAVTPATVSMVQGATRNDIGVAIVRTNFTGAVTLSLGGPVPVGVTATFAPTAPTANTATLAIVVGAAVTPGTYPLQIAGTGAPGARNTPFSLTVTQAGSFTMSIGPAGPVTLQPGGSDNSRTITITRTNYTPDITLEAEGLPTGVIASFAPHPVGGTTSVLTLTAAANAPTGGPHTITLRGTGPLALRANDSGTMDATASVSLQITIIPAGSFTLGMPASCAANFEIRQRALDDRRIITINRTNYTLPITFSIEGLPAGVTGGFDANPVTGDAVRLRFEASETATPGVHPLVLRGTGPGGATVTFPMSMDVRLPSDPWDPNLLSFDFTTDSEGWYRGFVCPFPTGGATHVDWGAVFFQEQMFGIDGRGPASNRTEPNSWVTRVIPLPAGATHFRFNASGHFLDDAAARVRIRVVDGTTSTVILTQVVTGSWPVRVFQTLEANIAPWAGKTVRFFVEHLDEPASHGQLWLDAFRIIGN